MNDKIGFIKHQSSNSEDYKDSFQVLAGKSSPKHAPVNTNALSLFKRKQASNLEDTNNSNHKIVLSPKRIEVQKNTRLGAQIEMMPVKLEIPKIQINNLKESFPSNKDEQSIRSYVTNDGDLSPNNKSPQHKKLEEEDDDDNYLSKIFKGLNENPPKDFNYNDMREFLTKPIPIGKTLKCNIIVKSDGIDYLFPKYNLCIENNGKVICSAKKMVKSTTSNFHISLEEDEYSKGNHYLGKLNANFLGTIYTIYDHGKKPSETNVDYQMYSLLGNITYETNLLGLYGPKKLKYYCPKVDEKSGSYFTFKSRNEKETIHSLYKKGKKENIMKMIAKEPKWSERHQAYILNFNGRAKQSSTRNFQLIGEGKSDVIYLLVGKIDDDVFSCDFQYPFTPLNAFATALSALDMKLA